MLPRVLETRVLSKYADVFTSFIYKEPLSFLALTQSEGAPEILGDRLSCQLAPLSM